MYVIIRLFIWPDLYQMYSYFLSTEHSVLVNIQKIVSDKLCKLLCDNTAGGMVLRNRLAAVY